MGIYIPVEYDNDDSFYVKNYGLESDSELAHWGPCKRSSFILHYVLKGKGYFNGTPVKENCGFFISPDVIREYHSSDDEPWSYFWIMFKGESVAEYVKKSIEVDEYGVFEYGFKTDLLRIFDMIKLENSITHCKAISYFYRILDLHQASAGASENRLISSAKAYISANYHTNITVKSIAEALHVSDRYLYNLFIKYTDTTPKRYIDKKRMDIAYDLLSNTELSVSEIGYSLGFKNVLRFSHFFKTHSGVSPTGFRSK